MEKSKYLIINNRVCACNYDGNNTLYKVIVSTCFTLFVALSQFSNRFNGALGLGARTGAYLMLFPAAAILMLWILCSKGRIRFSFNLFHLAVLAFPLFTLLTAPFSYLPSRTVGSSINLLEVSFVYIVFSAAWEEQKDDVDSLLAVIMFANYITAVYSLVYNGIDKYEVLLESGERIDNASINANSLGMTCAYAILIHIYFLKQKKYVLFSPLILLAGLSILLSQSRKGMLILGLGLLVLIVLLNYDKNHLVKALFKTLFLFILLIFLLLALSQTAVFSGVMERMIDFVEGMLGNKVDEYSFNARYMLKEIGRTIFLDHPLLGVGLDNSGLIAGPSFHTKYLYLHDNYIEILADTGVLGFTLYYFIYAFILGRMIHYRDFSNKEYCLCLTLLTIFLIMDYGCVTYIDKHTNFYLLVFWLEAEKIKRVSITKPVTESRYRFLR